MVFHDALLEQDPKPTASTSAQISTSSLVLVLSTNSLVPPSDSKGKTKKSGQSQDLTTPAKSTLSEYISRLYSLQFTDCDCKGEKLTKKSRKKEVPVEPPEASDKGQRYQIPSSLFSL